MLESAGFFYGPPWTLRDRASQKRPRLLLPKAAVADGIVR
jgi:hypothetical protein